jgi:hypothetical protein
MDDRKQAKAAIVIESLAEADLGPAVTGLIEELHGSARAAFEAEGEAARVFHDGMASGAPGEFLLGSERAGGRREEMRAALDAVDDYADGIVYLLTSNKAKGLRTDSWRRELMTAVQREAEELRLVLTARPVPGGISVDELNRLHLRVCEMLNELPAPSIALNSTDDGPVSCDAMKESDGDGLRGRDKAMALLARHPEWSDLRIAHEAGVSRTSLYRWPEFVKAKEILAEGKSSRPRGRKINGRIECWDKAPSDEGDTSGDS